MIEISVLIPTRNRAAFLGPCLASLCEQTLDPARYEICVINNASTDATPQVVELVKKHYPRHRLFMVDEPIPGLSQARNAGLAATAGALVASTDDDATAPPDWLARMGTIFAAQGDLVGKVGGEVDAVWGAPRPGWLTDGMLPLLSAATGFGDRPRYMDQGMLECNSCYRRAALNAAGDFPVRLGRRDAGLLSAEHAVDLVMNLAGWKLYFDPALRVAHTIHADRLTPGWMRRRYFWQGVSDYAVRVYLAAKGIAINHSVDIALPLDADDWRFINDESVPPTEADLSRLRSLGLVLARTGFIAV